MLILSWFLSCSISRFNGLCSSMLPAAGYLIWRSKELACSCSFRSLTEDQTLGVPHVYTNVIGTGPVLKKPVGWTGLQKDRLESQAWTVFYRFWSEPPGLIPEPRGFMLHRPNCSKPTVPYRTGQPDGSDVNLKMQKTRDFFCILNGTFKFYFLIMHLSAFWMINGPFNIGGL